ncbi:MAG: single-stranded-DNA-specific exonuclease RecJ [Elainellaceae cyanobacterium]
MPELSQWQLQPQFEIPASFLKALRQVAGLPGYYAAQLLWQRGIRDEQQLAGFLNPTGYSPTDPFEFGEEMQWAVQRLQQAHQQGEKVAIWGDFDADGITATAVLWEGLGAIFTPDRQLTYFIPNRLTESHGLSIAGIEQLAAWGCSLIVTCDTGSTNLTEILHAQQLGIDVIVTDHHTLPASRPPVVAIINPRSLPDDHPLAHLSGVAVAYKLVEALYATLPVASERSLSSLLDLVAIGLIADLVKLTGDCRYLAQCGIEQLQQNQNLQTSPRPGVAKLLELCKRNGDRPTDISFGLGPRINAISRIHGDARFCVELLTSRNRDRCQQLAEDAELANTRRKSLQRDVVQQVKAQLAHLDLSTTRVIVLSDPQWSVGILGLVAGQIAQEYGRPTILFSTEAVTGQNHTHTDSMTNLARGSARSVNQIDLYQLVQDQAHLLHSFGGHPLAMGLTLSADNIPLFTESINRQLRSQQGDNFTGMVVPAADLTVTVAELGKELFRELKLIEPCGMGNPAPRLLIQNAWFTEVWNRNIQDWRGRKVRYIKTEFEIWDDTAEAGFPGIWWDHYKDEIPTGRCDAIVELDFNTYKKRYEVRLLALRPVQQALPVSISAPVDWILDWREAYQNQADASGFQIDPYPSLTDQAVLPMTRCPASWDEMQAWLRRSIQSGKPLALAYPPPAERPPLELWQRLVGIAKYLSRTGKTVSQLQLLDKLDISDRALHAGFQALEQFGFQITSTDEEFHITWKTTPSQSDYDLEQNEAIAQFMAIVQEEQFRRRYFYQVPLATLQAIALNSFKQGSNSQPTCNS